MLSVFELEFAVKADLLDLSCTWILVRHRTRFQRIAKSNVSIVKYANADIYVFTSHSHHSPIPTSLVSPFYMLYSRFAPKSTAVKAQHLKKQVPTVCFPARCIKTSPRNLNLKRYPLHWPSSTAQRLTTTITTTSKQPRSNNRSYAAHQHPLRPSDGDGHQRSTSPRRRRSLPQSEGPRLHQTGPVLRIHLHQEIRGARAHLPRHK